jgi:glycerol transport system ATP-binding protein
MQLVLEHVNKIYEGQQWLHDINIAPQSGVITVLLGATQAGKTSTMRIMAGLDKVTSGRVLVDGIDVTHTSVKQRHISMVYQQFINYPSMTVAENIASPLKLQGVANPDLKVRELASKLHIEQFLKRYPSELSGGQQQRVALARALAKNAPLMLLDEPLVNLDYKLREQLRDELTDIFQHSNATVIYATTEPTEALLLGGYTAILSKGKLLQYGPTNDVFHHPKSIEVARAFSDPPMNFIASLLSSTGVQLSGSVLVDLQIPAQNDRHLTIGIRASALHLERQEGDVEINGTLQLSEISGSETYLYLNTLHGSLIAQLPGIHPYALGQSLNFYIHPNEMFVFDHVGALVLSPRSVNIKSGAKHV